MACIDIDLKGKPGLARTNHTSARMRRPVLGLSQLGQRLRICTLNSVFVILTNSCMYL